MKEFEARNPKQLDLCLRLLYAENVTFTVRITETEKRKIVYMINVNADNQVHEALREKYRILIS
jgi:hypothetical protein